MSTGFQNKVSLITLKWNPNIHQAIRMYDVLVPKTSARYRSAVKKIDSQLHQNEAQNILSIITHLHSKYS